MDNPIMNQKNTEIKSDILRQKAELLLNKKVKRSELELHLTDANNLRLIHELEVHKIEVTGHSDRRELMNFITRVNPRPKKVIINHGENSRCLDLASSIHKQFRIETVAPRDLETVRLK